MLDFGLARQYTNTTGEVRPVRPPSHASQGAAPPHHHSNRSACDVAHFLQLCLDWLPWRPAHHLCSSVECLIL